MNRVLRSNRFFCQDNWFRGRKVVFYDMDSVIQRKRGLSEFQIDFCKFYESLAIMEHRNGLVSNVRRETFRTLDEELKGKDIGFRLQNRVDPPLYGGLTSVFGQNIFLADWPFCNQNQFLEAFTQMNISGSDCVVILDKDNQQLRIKAEEVGVEVVSYGKDFNSYRQLLDKINDIVFYFCQMS